MARTTFMLSRRRLAFVLPAVLTLLLVGVGLAPAATAASYAVTGAVVDAEGDPLAGALVHTVTDEGWTATSTSSTGAFSILLPEGAHALTFDGPEGYAPATREVVVAGAGVDLGQVVLQPVPTGAVRVQVSNALGDPLPDIDVSLSSDADDHRSTETDATGTALLDQLRVGTWTVWLTDPSDVHAPRAVEVEVEEGETTSLPVVLTVIPRGDVTGRVADAAGTGLAGIEVSLSGPDGLHFTQTSTSTGAFSFSQVPAAVYEVALFDPTGEHQSLVLGGTAEVLGAQQLDLGTTNLVRNPGGTIRGRVVDPAGEPVEGVHVTATDEAAEVELFDATDENGSFAVRAAPGTYRVAVQDPFDRDWLELVHPTAVVLTEEGDVELGELVVQPVPKGSVSGTVSGLDASEQAEVRLHEVVDGHAVYVDSTWVTGSGTYRFDDVRAQRRYTVEVDAPRHRMGYPGGSSLATAARVEVQKDALVTLPGVTLVPTATVRGVVVLAGEPPAPVSDAAVQAVTAAGQVVTTYTAADGSFELELKYGPASVEIFSTDQNHSFASQLAQQGVSLGGSGSVDLGTVVVKKPVAPTSTEISRALDLPSGSVVSTSYDADPHAAQPRTEKALGFPREGDDYLVLSTGKLRALRGDPDSFYSTQLEGPDGVDGGDLSQVSLTLRPPAGATCLTFDFLFLSEEFPEYVGTTFNDIFTADLGSTEWTVEGQQVLAPHNFAFDDKGAAISVNTVGFSTRPGTAYDGASPLLQAVTPVETVLGDGTMEVILSIQDLGDSSYDSTVLVDDMAWAFGTDCRSGADALTDSDGDGLRDSWETEGIDHDGDGVPELDLPALGADPQRADVFLEIDWMEREPSCIFMFCWGGRSFAPDRAAVDDVVDAFADAPVTNPDGSTGITLHVDVSNEVGHQSSLGSFTDDGDYDWGDFDDVKRDHFPAVRRDAFHYVLYADTYGESGSSGISRGIPGGDLLVTDGDSGWGDGFTRTQERGTLMHELGHNLDLPRRGARRPVQRDRRVPQHHELPLPAGGHR